MRPLSLPAVLAACVLLLAACGGGGDDGGTATPSPDATAADGATELSEGVAALVNGTEIPTDQLEARVETASESPEVAEILEGEDGAAALAQLRASILSQMIVNRIVLDGAEERGLEVDDEAIEETREELAEQAGGEEAFEEQVEQAGLDADQLASELEAITALRLVREDLSAEADTPAAGPSPDGTTPDPADALLQQWLLERLQAAEVQVDPEIGSWDPAQGAVVPPAVPAPATEGTTDEPTGPASPSPADTASPTATETATEEE